METISKKSLLLLKASDNIINEKSEALESHIEINVLPVLDFELINLNDLQVAFMSPHKFSAIIFTSVRGVQSFQQLLEQENFALAWNRELKGEWMKKIVYVVGPSTATPVESIGFITKGKDSGNSDNLSDIIIADMQSSAHLPLLFISGDLKLDTLPQKLKDNNIDYQNIISYKTIFHKKFDENFLLLLSKQGVPDYIVFYSPSGVKYAGDIVLKNCTNSKFLAIGPTTADAMEKAGFIVHATPKKPSLSSILKAL